MRDHYRYVDVSQFTQTEQESQRLNQRVQEIIEDRTFQGHIFTHMVDNAELRPIKPVLASYIDAQAAGATHSLFQRDLLGTYEGLSIFLETEYFVAQEAPDLPQGQVLSIFGINIVMQSNVQTENDENTFNRYAGVFAHRDFFPQVLPNTRFAFGQRRNVCNIMAPIPPVQ